MLGYRPDRCVGRNLNSVFPLAILKSCNMKTSMIDIDYLRFAPLRVSRSMDGKCFSSHVHDYSLYISFRGYISWLIQSREAEWQQELQFAEEFGQILGLYIAVLRLHPILKYLRDSLERQSSNVREEEDNEERSEEANTRIETKRSRWSHRLHHCQEGRSNNEVAAPASNGVHHGSQSTYFGRQKLRSHPRNRGDAAGEEGNVEYDHDQHEDASPIHRAGLNGEAG